MAAEMTNEDLLFFNGINCSRGDYGLPPMTGEELAGFIKGEKTPENFDELKNRYDTKDIAEYGVKEGVDVNKLEEAGWGVIFPAGFDPTIKEALQPLLEWRRGLVGPYYRCYDGTEIGPDGKTLEPYYPGDSSLEFLGRNMIGPGPADPEKVPYYLLLVGGPGEIPYEFQYHLDVQYAVGRIHFDTTEAYANYAQSVVAAEKKKVNLPRRLSFFGVENEDDKSTQLSAEYLIRPLLQKLKNKPDWEIAAFLGEKATKAQLAQLLGGDQTPALLFTASHGAEFDNGDPRQIFHQGALVCQDYPGPKKWKALNQGQAASISQDFYFAGDDLTTEASLHGLLTFHFACFGAGTPLEDDFYERAFSKPKEIAPRPFVAQLPMKMLSHPRGGALATVGHVERAWGYSFLWPEAGSAAQTVVFESTIERLLKGMPVGAAVEYFNERYAEMATVLADAIRKAKFGRTISPYKLANMWTANNDARSYVIIGDPAVRLPVAEAEATPQERAALTLQPVASVEFSAAGSELVAPPPPSDQRPPRSRAVAEADVDYSLRETAADVAERLKPVAQRLMDMLTTAVDDLTSLEVQTFTANDLSQVTYENKKFSDEATLRAMTRIALDGDVVSLVPERKRSNADDEAGQVEVEIDQQLWEIHREMVDLAQANKVAFVKALAEIAGTLVKMT